MVSRLQRHIERRNAVYRNPTLEAAAAYYHAEGFPPPHAPDVPLAMVHKARLQWLGATDAMLAESRQWLQENGYATTMRGGMPLTPATRDFKRMSQGMPPLHRAPK